MDLLIKNVADPLNPRNDNADKKKLFVGDDHTESAESKRGKWKFIVNEDIQHNVSYQLQYIEFLTRVYNEYQIYLTYESLLCKNIMTSVCAIAEAALFSVISNARAKGGLSGEWRTDFTALIGSAYNEYQLIDTETRNYFHELRLHRNTLHIQAADFKEHRGYGIERANEALKMLEELRVQLIEVGNP